MKLVVTKPARIYVRRGVVRVRLQGGGEEVIDSTVDGVLIATSRVSITARAIRILSGLGIDVVFLARNGEPVARVYPIAMNKTVLSRRAQFEALLNGLGLAVARVIVKAKVSNQGALLRYMGKALREDWLRNEAVKLDELALMVDRAKGPSELIELEAQAARHYWQALAQVLPGDYGFRGRDQEGKDPFNLMLNYGYGVLRYSVEKVLLIHGLDPYAGFLHSDKSGKPSLTQSINL